MGYLCSSFKAAIRPLTLTPVNAKTGADFTFTSKLETTHFRLDALIIPPTMALQSPSPRVTATFLWKPRINYQQLRHATLIRRPKRPYTFTQLVTLSDGSTFTHRTTSPTPVYESTKDSRNTALWNPSSQKLLNVEADEAGRLRAFRERFGRGWDAETMTRRDEETGEVKEREDRSEEDNLMDLISGYGAEAEEKGEAKGIREEKERSGKRKGGER
ncbi:MAG: hypothetical protein Q9201_001131 [Fulgogasparrea decipioides]